MANEVIPWSLILELKRGKTLPEVCLIHAEAVEAGDEYTVRACLEVINLLVRLDGGWEELIAAGHIRKKGGKRHANQEHEDEYVTLYHGDYREALPQGLRADAVITDPPYGETSLGWDRWVTDWPDDMSRISDAMWCFGSMRMFFDNLTQFSQWKFSHELVWEKHNGSGFAADKFRRVHEFATLWYRGDWAGIRHEVPKVPGAVKRTVRRKERPAHMGEIAGSSYTSVDGGDLLMRSVLKIRSEHGRAVHPTQKPGGIISPLIEYSVSLGGLVVDPFAGSGTTGVVARMLGRRAILCEAQAEYADAAAQRLSQQTFDFAGLELE